MGAITDKVQDENDARMMINLAELCPAYKRFHSHHHRNSLQVIMNGVEIALKKIDDPSEKWALSKALYQIKDAAEHMAQDFERSGI